MQQRRTDSEDVGIRNGSTSPVYDSVKFTTSGRQCNGVGKTGQDKLFSDQTQIYGLSTGDCTGSLDIDSELLSSQEVDSGIHCQGRVPTGQGQGRVPTGHCQGRVAAELLLPWKLVMVFASVYTGTISVGFGYSLSVLYAELVRVFSVSRASVAMIQSVHMGFVLGSSILWNYPFKRFGPGPCMVACSVIFSVSIVISAFSTNIEMFICFIGVFAGLSGSVLNLGPYLIMGRVFKKRRNSVLALLTCGASIGQMVLTYGLEMLISEYGWSGALLLRSGLALNTIPCCILIHVKTAAIEGFEENSDENKLIKPFLFKSWRFVLLLVNSFVFSMSMLAESKFLVDLTVMKGFDLATGSLFASLIGVTNLIGRCIGAGINAVDTGRSFLYLSVSILLAVGAHLLVLLTGDYYGLMVGALVSGLSFGLSVSQLVVMMLDIFPLAHFAAAIAMWNLMGGVGSAFGGYIGGLISDLTASYDLLFEVSAVGCLFDSVCMLIIYLSLVIARKRRGYTPM